MCLNRMFILLSFCLFRSTNISEGLLSASLWLEPGDTELARSDGEDRNAHRLSARGVRAVTERYTGVCRAQGSYL